MVSNFLQNYTLLVVSMHILFGPGSSMSISEIKLSSAKQYLSIPNVIVIANQTFSYFVAKTHYLILLLEGKGENNLKPSSIIYRWLQYWNIMSVYNTSSNVREETVGIGVGAVFGWPAECAALRYDAAGSMLKSLVCVISNLYASVPA